MSNTPISGPPKATLLIVDDTPANLFAIEVLLRPSYQLLIACSGKECLEMLQKHEIDVILLDIQMPDIDGYETARRIKQIEAYKNIPIIFITAIFTESPHVKKGYEAGAIDYFTKPFDPDILKTKIAIYSSFRQKDLLLKEREKRLKETEELLNAGRKLSAILESLPVGVIIADKAGRIVQTNDELLRMLKSVDSLGNNSYGDFLAWWTDGGHSIKVGLTHALSSGQSTHNEILQMTCFDETPKTVLRSISPLRGFQDEIVGAVAVIQDITEHRKIEEDLEQRILNLITLGLQFEKTRP